MDLFRFTFPLKPKYTLVSYVKKKCWLHSSLLSGFILDGVPCLIWLIGSFKIKQFFFLLLFLFFLLINLQAVDKFVLLADHSSKVPKLKNKKSQDYSLTEEEWSLLQLIKEVLKVFVPFSRKKIYLQYIYCSSFHVLFRLNSLCKSSQLSGKHFQFWNIFSVPGKIYSSSQSSVLHQEKHILLSLALGGFRYL